MNRDAWAAVIGCACFYFGAALIVGHITARGAGWWVLGTGVFIIANTYLNQKRK